MKHYIQPQTLPINVHPGDLMIPPLIGASGKDNTPLNPMPYIP